MAHYTAGCSAALANILLTFPVNKTMFRQQLHGLRVTPALCQLRSEGLRQLYRGLLPPVLQKTTTLALMFGLYEDLSLALLDSVPEGTPSVAVRSLAAVLAGSVEAAFMPFERVQVLLQDRKHCVRFYNTLDAFKQLRTYGLKEYYRGLTPVLLRNGPSNALFFGLRGPIKELLPTAPSPGWHLLNDFFCGGLLGALLSTAFYPVNVVKVRMQSEIGGEFRSFSHFFSLIWHERQRNVSFLFRGVHLNYQRSLLLRGMVQRKHTYLNVVQFLTRLETVQSVFPSKAAGTPSLKRLLSWMSYLPAFHHLQSKGSIVRKKLLIRRRFADGH
uniref:Solute carrier family 25 member 51b n=1 Tax=Eptatretus burgeri TaxID=7764 RepID=A0A8C4Q5E1_EPTBU